MDGERYSERLRTLIEEENITQKKLAEIIGTTEQTISKAVTGKRMTKRLAREICVAFPRYNVEWLLGYNFPKYAEQNPADALELLYQIAYNEKVNRSDIIAESLASIASVIGFIAVYQEGRLKITNKDLKQATLSSEELEELREDTAALLAYRFNKILKKRGQL